MQATTEIWQATACPFFCFSLHGNVQLPNPTVHTGTAKLAAAAHCMQNKVNLPVMLAIAATALGAAFQESCHPRLREPPLPPHLAL